MNVTLREAARSALFWSALPLIAAQGLWLCRRAPRFAEAAGERGGRVGYGRALRLLAVGDSIIAGVGVAHIEQSLPVQFADQLAARCRRQVHWRALGRNGARADGSLRALHQHPDWLQGSDLLLVSSGVNDVTSLRRRDAFARDLAGMLELSRQRAPGCRVVFAGVPPLQAFPLLPSPLRHLLGMRAGAFDRAMARLAPPGSAALHAPAPFQPAAERFAADGFHPHAGACSEWAAALSVACLLRWPELGDIDNRL